MLTTYLLRRDAEPSQTLASFIERLASMELNEVDRSASIPQSYASEKVGP